jgi:hypothetical protein
VAGVARGLVPGRSDGSVTLDEDDVQAIAERVLELLRERDGRAVRLVDAAALARTLGVGRDWVYARARELGAVRLGDGPKARLRFDPERAAAALAMGAGGEPPPPEEPRRRRARPRKQAASAEVRLIQGRGGR